MRHFVFSRKCQFSRKAPQLFSCDNPLFPDFCAWLNLRALPLCLFLYIFKNNFKICKIWGNRFRKKVVMNSIITSDQCQYFVIPSLHYFLLDRSPGYLSWNSKAQLQFITELENSSLFGTSIYHLWLSRNQDNFHFLSSCLVWLIFLLLSQDLHHIIKGSTHLKAGCGCWFPKMSSSSRSATTSRTAWGFSSRSSQYVVLKMICFSSDGDLKQLWN